MASQQTYIPGVCNIGPAEIRMRRWTGHIGLAATIFLIGSYVASPADPATRLFIFFPAAVATLGYMQAAMHFCAQFGIFGIFNVSQSFGKRESVEQREFRRKDQRKALLIIASSVSVGILVALIAYLFPF
jgi:hypothetical protein